MAKTRVNNPFAICERDIVNVPQTDFDTDYRSIQIVDYVEKIGEGEDDYVIKQKVVEDFKPIADVVGADAESVGVYNIIKQVMRTGDTSILPVDKGDCDVDFVGAPENLMELKQMGVDAEKAFAGLPADLVGDLDMTKFIESMSQEKFDAFVAAIQKRAEKKEEVNVNE